MIDKKERYVQKPLNIFSRKFDINRLKKLIDFLFKIFENIALKFDKILQYYIKFYDDMIPEEINLGEISSKSKVLHIGCGPIPSTSILIAQKTKAEITGIDKNDVFVKRAEKCLKKIGDVKNIKIFCADALDFEKKGYDVILLSHGLEPQKQVLEGIHESINNNCIVIFRTFSDRNGSLKQEDVFLKELFEIKGIIYHKNHGRLISVGLVKK